MASVGVEQHAELAMSMVRVGSIGECDHDIGAGTESKACGDPSIPIRWTRRRGTRKQPGAAREPTALLPSERHCHTTHGHLAALAGARAYYWAPALALAR